MQLPLETIKKLTSLESLGMHTDLFQKRLKQSQDASRSPLVQRPQFPAASHGAAAGLWHQQQWAEAVDMWSQHLHCVFLEALPRMNRLSILDLSSSFPSGEEISIIGNLQSPIEFLNLSSNMLESLPEDFGQTGLASLHFLDLSNNLLSFLPPAILRLPTLMRVNADNNRMLTPKDVGQCDPRFLRENKIHLSLNGNHPLAIC